MMDKARQQVVTDLARLCTDRIDTAISDAVQLTDTESEAQLLVMAVLGSLISEVAERLVAPDPSLSKGGKVMAMAYVVARVLDPEQKVSLDEQTRANIYAGRMLKVMQAVDRQMAGR
jgi:hypothetical protein